MESCFYETIHETDLLHVRFELQDAPAFVFPAHWHETITVLMEKNGLSNYKIFMRTFKKLYGSTPQKMRSNRIRHV